MDLQDATGSNAIPLESHPGRWLTAGERPVLAPRLPVASEGDDERPMNVSDGARGDRGQPALVSA
jgi:hypothetical protein